MLEAMPHQDAHSCEDAPIPVGPERALRCLLGYCIRSARYSPVYRHGDANVSNLSAGAPALCSDWAMLDSLIKLGLPCVSSSPHSWIVADSNRDAWLYAPPSIPNFCQLNGDNKCRLI